MIAVINTMIRHLKNREINREAWNQTIALSANSLPYAYAWFLDVVSPQWEALVWGDYEYVMPLPVKQKFGIKYVIQPCWTQQLGIFSPKPISSEIVKLFLAKIPYLCYDFSLNFGNVFGQSKPNSIIALNRPYDEISKAFSQNTRRNIAKAKSANLAIKNIDYQLLVDFWRANNSDKAAELSAKLPLLCEATEKNGIGRFYGVFMPDNELVATLMTLENKQRIIYLVPTSNQRGKELCAMFMLVAHLLKLNAESDKIFDCEGSQIAGVARFCAGFGAISQPYYTVKRCRPQWLVKLIHR